MNNKTIESKFTGGVLGLIGINILTVLIVIFTIGICTPWAIVIRQHWFTKHRIIDGNRLTFDGTGGQLFGSYIKWFLLTIITIGIYGFWLPIKIQQWTTKHTHIA